MITADKAIVRAIKRIEAMLESEYMEVSGEAGDELTGILGVLYKAIPRCPQFRVRITYDGGFVTYLGVKGRTSWGERTAEKHATAFAVAHGRPGTEGKLPFVTHVVEV